MEGHVIEPRFSCQEQLIPGDTYTEKFAFLAETGFRGIEVWSHNLAANVEELSRLSAETGVRVSSGCQSFNGGIIDIDEKARRTAIDAIKDALDALAAVGGAGFVVPAGFALGSKALPPFKPPRPPDEDAAALGDALAEILPRAAEREVSLFLEPINRYESHYLNTLAEAEAVVKQAASPWLSITADLFHMSIEEADPAGELARTAPHVGHVHLADSNRRLPGQGHLNLEKHFTSLLQAGYGGWLAVECDRPTDAARELPPAFAVMQRAWQAAVEHAEG
jgi:sugar phosphate isomerase/epimerase